MASSLTFLIKFTASNLRFYEKIMQMNFEEISLEVRQVIFKMVVTAGPGTFLYNKIPSSFWMSLLGR